MRIVIDLQGALSTGSARRGIGRYSSSLALAMARAPRSHEIVLALNNRFPELSDEMRQAFDGLVEPSNVHSWSPPPFWPEQSAASRRASERLYEVFIASLRPDAVHVTSLFEGWVDEATSSIGECVRQPTSATLYDLIPFINADRYLSDTGVRSWYLHKLESLKRADRLLSISESSRREAIEFLGMPADRIVNVSTAAYGHFKPIALATDEKAALLSRYGLRKPFVMYTGGIDLRKNIEGLIQAFAALPRSLCTSRQLAVVCAAREEEKAALLDVARKAGLDGDDLVLTGFVSEDDLIAFYNLCELFVFPSWHEGFGLPALEAMHCGAAVIGANTSSVPEVIGREDALFDPYDPSAIAQKMASVLADENFAQDLRNHGPIQAARFSWEASAATALDAIEELHSEQSSRGVTVQFVSAPVGLNSQLKPRLAYLSPLPPERSGIAIYSAELLPYLADHYRIELITPDGHVSDSALNASFPVRSVGWLIEHADQFDRILYQVGNSQFHAHMFDLLERLPGVVVLHDFFLSGALAHMELHLGMGPVWRRELFRSHGYSALASQQASGDAAKIIYEFPCSLGVLRSAKATIAHSDYSKHLAAEWFGTQFSDRIHHIPHLRLAVADSDGLRRKKARKALHLPFDAFMVCAFGIVNPTKLNHRLVDCWKRSKLGKLEGASLVFVGQNDGGPYGEQLVASIQDFPSGNIRITGWTESATYQQFLEAADIAVQLRTLSRGETSGAVLDAMAHGLPTIVNANGSMASIASDCVWMLPDDFQDEELIAALDSLGLDPQRRADLGQRALTKVQQSHSPAYCANAYAEVIEAAFRESESIDSPMGCRSMLVKWLRDHDPLPSTPAGARELAAQAQAISSTLPGPAPSPRHFIDVSAIALNEPEAHYLEPIRTLLSTPIAGKRVELVTWDKESAGYLYARRFALAVLGIDDAQLLMDDAAVDFSASDVLTILVPTEESAERVRAVGSVRAMGTAVERVEIRQFAAYVQDQFGLDVPTDLHRALRAEAPPLDASPEVAFAAAGLPVLAQPDFNHLLHHLRGTELSQLPRDVDCFVSVGCAGTWYFEWVQDLCAPKRHVGIEFYSPKPNDLPANAEWICNTAGDMSDVPDASADVLFSGQNIEHLWPHDIIAFLRESHRVIKPGGLIAIDSPNRLVASELGWSHPEHILEFTPDEISRVMEAAGFTVTGLRGAWSCVDESTGKVLPLAEFHTSGPMSVKRRIDVGIGSPRNAFSWWLEARRADLVPDWPQVAHLVNEAFATGWPDRVNRLVQHGGTTKIVEGSTWVEFNGPAGLILSGPPMPLPKGSYTVGFQIRGQVGTQLESIHTPLVAVDVIRADGEELAARIVSGVQLRANPLAACVKFDLHDTTFGLTFRLMAVSDLRIEVRRQVFLTSHGDPSFSTAPGDVPQAAITAA